MIIHERENIMKIIKTGDTVKSHQNDYTTYTVLKVYVNKQDNQTYLNVQADNWPKNIFVKQHISLFEKV